MLGLKTRSRAILDYILLREGYVTPDEVATHLHVSKRTIYYDLNEINNWLQANDIPPITIKRQKGLFVSENHKTTITTLLGHTAKTNYYVFSPKERIAVISVEILSSPIVLHIEDFCTLCNVSRNTILNDLRFIKNSFAKYELVLTFDVRSGYHVQGQTIQKRAVFLYYLAQITHLINRGILDYLQNVLIQNNMALLSEIESELGEEYVDNTLLQMAILLAMIVWQQDELPSLICDQNEITASREFALVQQKFSGLPLEEQLYITIQLLGARVQFPKQVHEKQTENYFVLSSLANSLIIKFEQIACITFNDRNDLLQKLIVHLSSSFYRYRYGILEGNPIALGIDQKYPELFIITQKVVDSLSQEIGYPIQNSDIAYLALHFGSHFRTSILRKCVVRILVVCQNGVATAQFLRNELEELVPFIEVIDIISARELQHYSHPYDLIVSTVRLESCYNAIIVNPLLTVEDNQTVLARVLHMTKSNRQKDDAEQVFHLLENYIDKKDHTLIRRELMNYFSSKHSLFREVLSPSHSRLTHFLTPENIQIIENSINWRDSIALAAAPLLTQGHIRQGYIDTMITSVETMGAYIFITPDIAIAHAKPCDDIAELSVSLLIIRNGVAFDADRRAKIIIVLAPIDDKQHLGVLKDILFFFNNKQNLKRLLNVEDEAAAYSLLSSKIHGSPLY